MAKMILKTLVALVLGAAVAEHASASSLRFISKPDDLPPAVAARIDALALIKVYPFKNRNNYVQCTGLHIGSGTILTAGHCFLGAYRCNNAEVTFGVPGREAHRARCTQVLMNEAAGSAYTSSRLDYALFKVDNPPAAGIEVPSNTRQPRLDVPMVLVGYPRLSRPRNRDVLAVAEGCGLSDLTGTDFFGRPRSLASVLHNCSTVPGMNGGILFGLPQDASETGLVALQQAGSIEPEVGVNPLTLTSIDNVAQSLARLAPIQNYRPLWLNSLSRLGGKAGPGALRQGRDGDGTVNQLPHVIASPAEVRIGMHLAEVFPLGIADPLTVDVAKFAAAEGSSGRLRVATRVGSGSQLTITDVHGESTVIKGTSFYESSLSKSYDAPLTITLDTDKDSKAFQATVRLSPDN